MKKFTKAALAAKQIRSILKKEFPSTKFSVKSSNFSMGDCVDISWTDGASKDEVRKLISHFEHTKYNSTEDLFEPSNMREDIPQAKHIWYDRKISN